MNLGDGQLGAHVAQALDVIVCLSCLEELTRLNNRLKSLDGARLCQSTVSDPLLQVAHVVPDLNAFRPVAHLLAQYEVVEGVGSDEVE